MGKYSWSDKEAERREQRRPKPEKRQVKIAKRTDKGAKEDKLYSQLRVKFLEENPACQCGLPGCTKKATQVHHKKGRGIWLLIVKYWLAVCANCHKFIEENPKIAKGKGYSIKRLD